MSSGCPHCHPVASDPHPPQTLEAAQASLPHLRAHPGTQWGALEPQGQAAPVSHRAPLLLLPLRPPSSSLGTHLIPLLPLLLLHLESGLWAREAMAEGKPWQEKHCPPGHSRSGGERARGQRWAEQSSSPHGSPEPSCFSEALFRPGPGARAFQAAPKLPPRHRLPQCPGPGKGGSGWRRRAPSSQPPAPFAPWSWESDTGTAPRSSTPPRPSAVCPLSFLICKMEAMYLGHGVAGRIPWGMAPGSVGYGQRRQSVRSRCILVRMHPHHNLSEWHC